MQIIRRRDENYLVADARKCCKNISRLILHRKEFKGKLWSCRRNRWVHNEWVGEEPALFERWYLAVQVTRNSEFI